MENNEYKCELKSYYIAYFDITTHTINRDKDKKDMFRQKNTLHNYFYIYA